MSEEQQEDLKRTEKEDKRNYKKPLIIVGIILVILIIIGLVIYFVINTQDAEAQVKEFEKAVEKKDYSKLSNLLTTNEQHVTEQDAQHFVNYLGQGNNKDKFDKQITQIKNNIKDKGQYNENLGEIKDNNNHTYIKLKKDGKRFFFIDKITYEPVFYNVYIKEGNNTASYQYKNNNDKRTDVTANKNKTTKLGEFFIGNYDMDATKEFKEDESLVTGSVDGSIHINTDELDKESKVLAQDHFDQAWFKVRLKNNEKIKKIDHIYIDGNKVNYKENKVYGKYPAESELNVYSEGELDGENIKTNKVDVKQNDKNEPQVIELKFNQKQIDEHMKKKNKAKNEAKDFMKKYTEDLNKAYDKSNFEHVRDYFDDQDSELARHIKKQVTSKKKSKYSEPKFEKVEDKGNEVNLILSKTDNKDNLIRSSYTLKYDKKKDKFTIKAYTDI